MSIPLFRRRRFGKTLLSALAVAALAPAAGAFAQADAPRGYPDRPIRLITVGAPGSISDTMPRLITHDLAAILGQPVIVENRPGGSGMVGANAGAAAPPDGYAIFLGSLGTLAINPYMLKDMTLDPRTAFVPLGLVGSMPMVLTVNPKATPVRNVKELVELAKKKPGELSYGSLGSGSTSNIVTQVFQKDAGISLIHVPYKGSSAIFTDTLAGRLTIAFDNIGVAQPFIQDGRVRALAVSTRKRSALLPDVPTMQEEGYKDLELSAWYALYAPAGTPPAIAAKLADAIGKVMRKPDIRKRFEALGLEAGDLFGKDFADFHNDEIVRWGKTIKMLGLKPE